MRGALMFIAGALAACDPSLVTVELAPDQAKSVVILYLTPDNTLVEALAFDTDGGTATLPRHPGTKVYALSYRCPMSAVGIRTPRLTLSDAGRSLPRPHLVREGEGTRMAPEGWGLLGALPDAVQRLKFELRPARCQRYQLEPQFGGFISPLKAIDMATLGVARDRLITLSTEFPAIQVWHRTATEPEFELGFQAYSAQLSGFTDALGASYILSRAGVLRLGNGYELQTLGGEGAWGGCALTGPSDGDARRDLFLARPDGRVEHFDGSAWTTLAPGGGEIIGTPGSGAAWLGPQTALLTGTGRSDTVLLASDGHLREERVFEAGPGGVVLGPASERIRGAEYVAALGGVVVYTSGGRAWLREDSGRYVALELGEPRPTAIDAVVATGQGFIVAARQELIEYDAHEGACASRHTGFGDVVLAMRAGAQGRVEIYSGSYTSSSLTSRQLFQLLPESPPDEACD